MAGQSKKMPLKQQQNLKNWFLQIHSVLVSLLCKEARVRNMNTIMSLVNPWVSEPVKYIYQNIKKPAAMEKYS